MDGPMPGLRVPDQFARDTVIREGPAGAAWIAALPERIQACCARWDLALDGDPRHGYLGLVLPVRRRDGLPAALKITWLDPESAPESDALRAWDGRGAVRLLAADGAGALLLARLRPDATLEQPTIDSREATRLVGALLPLLHVRPPPGLRRVSALAATWVDELPRRARASRWPLPPRLLDAALDVCGAAAPAHDTTLLHTDLHFANVLADGEGRWTAIDPKPLAGPRGFESAPVLWNRWPELAYAPDPSPAVRDRLALWCAAARVEEPDAARWALVRSVAAGLWALPLGLTEFAMRCRLVAEAVLPLAGG